MDSSEKKSSTSAEDSGRTVVDIEEELDVEEDAAHEADDAGSDEDEPRAEAVDSRLTYIRDLELRLAKNQATLGEYVAAYKQLKDDNESFKARLEREKAKELDILRGKLVQDLLELMDNLDRSVMGAEASRNYDALNQGIKMVLHQFEEKMAKLGVSRIDTVGHAFDPNRHEAIDVAPTDNADEDGVVLIEYSRGFSMGERVIRPARVRVGRHSG